MPMLLPLLALAPIRSHPPIRRQPTATGPASQLSSAAVLLRHRNCPSLFPQEASSSHCFLPIRTPPPPLLEAVHGRLACLSSAARRTAATSRRRFCPCLREFGSTNQPSHARSSSAAAATSFEP